MGALVVKDGQVIGRGYNRRETDADATAHAEMLAIREACRSLEGWRLEGCTLFVTLEPCPMCTGAILQSLLSQVVFGAFDPLLRLLRQPPLPDRGGRALTPTPSLYGGVLERECAELLQEFFARRRGGPEAR